MFFIRFMTVNFLFLLILFSCCVYASHRDNGEDKKPLVINHRIVDISRHLGLYQKGHAYMEETDRKIPQERWIELYREEIKNSITQAEYYGREVVEIRIADNVEYGRYDSCAFIRLWRSDASRYLDKFNALYPLANLGGSIMKGSGNPDFIDLETKALQKKWESLKVEHNPIVGTNPEAGSNIIRRCWRDYIASYPFHRLVLCSGHLGPHSKTFNTTQGDENYMFDICWEEVRPDAVLDITDPNQMAYIPLNHVDEIVVDDSRPFSDNIIPECFRMLKQGGKLVFKPGSGLGWPQVLLTERGEEIILSESGRYGFASASLISKISHNRDIRQAFIHKAISAASTFYSNIGFSEISYDETHGVFILKK